MNNTMNCAAIVCMCTCALNLWALALQNKACDNNQGAYMTSLYALCNTLGMISDHRYVLRKSSGESHPGHTFVPASVTTCGYLGKPLVRFLNTFSEVAAAGGPAVTECSVLPGAHCELSVALINCQGAFILVLPTSWPGLRAVRCC